MLNQLLGLAVGLDARNLGSSLRLFVRLSDAIELQSNSNSPRIFSIILVCSTCCRRNHIPVATSNVDASEQWRRWWWWRRTYQLPLTILCGLGLRGGVYKLMVRLTDLIMI